MGILLFYLNVYPMSKLHPTESQIKYREKQKRKKRARLEARRQHNITRWLISGCLQSESSNPQHNWTPRDCGCYWGCDMCKYSYVCTLCGDYR